MITGIVFGILAAIHVWRYIEEGSGVADAFFVGVTLLAAGFALWAFRLLRSLPRG
jgi:hypothetical protein